LYKSQVRMLGDAVSVMMMLIEGWMDAVVVMVLGCALERGLLPRCLQGNLRWFVFTLIRVMICAITCTCCLDNHTKK